MVDLENNEQNSGYVGYVLNSNSIEYRVEISIKNENKKILIIIKETNILQNYYYKAEFSLEELKSINKNFRIFDKIDEVYKELNELFLNKKASLQVKSTEILLHLFVSNFSSSNIQDIFLKIIKTNINNEEMNELLIKEINHMKEEHLNLKNKMEQKVKSLEEKNESLIKIIEELGKSLKELSDYKNNKEKYYINSEIITEVDEIKLIYDRLINKGFFKNKNPKFQLIYRASRDGDSSTIYKNKIQGIKNFLCIIQTKKGCKFGGYSEAAPDFSK